MQNLVGFSTETWKFNPTNIIIAGIVLIAILVIKSYVKNTKSESINNNDTSGDQSNSTDSDFEKGEWLCPSDEVNESLMHPKGVLLETDSGEIYLNDELLYNGSYDDFEPHKDGVVIPLDGKARLFKTVKYATSV